MNLDFFQSPGRFFRGNLHTHSTRSDGKLAPEAVATHYRFAGDWFRLVVADAAGRQAWSSPVRHPAA